MMKIGAAFIFKAFSQAELTMLKEAITSGKALL